LCKIMNHDNQFINIYYIFFFLLYIDLSLIGFFIIIPSIDGSITINVSIYIKLPIKYKTINNASKLIFLISMIYFSFFLLERNTRALRTYSTSFTPNRALITRARAKK